MSQESVITLESDQKNLVNYISKSNIDLIFQNFMKETLLPVVVDERCRKLLNKLMHRFI